MTCSVAKRVIMRTLVLTSSPGLSLTTSTVGCRPWVHENYCAPNVERSITEDVERRDRARRRREMDRRGSGPSRGDGLRSDARGGSSQDQDKGCTRRRGDAE